jgi:LysM repeat protein
MRFITKAFLLIALLAILTVSTTAASAYTSCTHVVRAGENLFRISLNYGVSMWDVAELNGILDLRRIYVGQVLRLPLPGCGYDLTPTDPIVDPYDPYDPYDPGITDGYYIVQAGDTLNKIAARFGVTVQALMAANHLSHYTTIYVGQKLIIPGSDTSTNGDDSTNGTLACGPGVHQINCWPEYGGNWAEDSIRNEPLITQWETCRPEEINFGDLLACSKTGLGWFPWTPPPDDEEEEVTP